MAKNPREVREPGVRQELLRQGNTRSEVKRPSPWSRTRLSTMPLAVLLPQLSDVGSIAQYRSDIEALLERAQDQLETSESSEPGTAQVEQSMLQQVLQWLDVDSEE